MDGPVDVIVAPRCRGQASMGGHHGGCICRGVNRKPKRAFGFSPQYLQVADQAVHHFEIDILRAAFVGGEEHRQQLRKILRIEDCHHRARKTSPTPIESKGRRGVAGFYAFHFSVSPAFDVRGRFTSPSQTRVKLPYYDMVDGLGY